MSSGERIELKDKKINELRQTATDNIGKGANGSELRRDLNSNLLSMTNFEMFERMVEILRNREISINKFAKDTGLTKPGIFAVIKLENFDKVYQDTILRYALEYHKFMNELVDILER